MVDKIGFEDNVNLIVDHGLLSPYKLIDVLLACILSFLHRDSTDSQRESHFKSDENPISSFPLQYQIKVICAIFNNKFPHTPYLTIAFDDAESLRERLKTILEVYFLH